ncbi:MAG: alpha/beta fold hydrolase [Gemmatimonadetes bacterium]|nr:alpha/beta fold hydrolase [Gemmatimonadota bacterium]
MTTVLAGLMTSGHEGGPAPRPPHRAFTVTADGLMLRAVRAGQGPTVLLIHGYGESLLSWQSVFDRLSRRADVVAIDLPGSGLSSKPAHGYATDSLGSMVLQALDALRIEEAILVGHSLGGAVAMAAAVAAPTRVRGLVLIDPAVATMPWVLRPSSSGALTPLAVRRAVARYTTLRSRLTGAHDPGWLGEPDSALRYDPAADPAYSVALESLLREFDFGYLNAARARRLGMPILILWGEYDPLLPVRAGRALAGALPGASFEIIPRSWHRPHVERPGYVASRIAQFLDRGRRSAGRSSLWPATPRPRNFARRTPRATSAQETPPDPSDLAPRPAVLADGQRVPRDQVSDRHRDLPRHSRSRAAGRAAGGPRELSRRAPGGEETEGHRHLGRQLARRVPQQVGGNQGCRDRPPVSSVDGAGSHA